MRTNARGVATFTLAPTGDDRVRLVARATGLAANFPRIFRPTEGPAAVNGQRLAVPASQSPRRVTTRRVTKANLRVTTRAVPRRPAVGAVNRDRVRFRGVSPAWRQRSQVLLHGPFRSKAEISCAGVPAWRSSFVARAGTVRTPRVRPRRIFALGTIDARRTDKGGRALSDHLAPIVDVELG